MITLEQVKLLESRITKTIDYVKKVTGENTALKGKLNSCKKRIDELEVLVKRFREEQSRIEDSILSAIDRLNQFEDAVESVPPAGSSQAAAASAAANTPSAGSSQAAENKNSDGGELDIF